MESAEDQLTTTARAFATYALVPYLGIIFCPGALLVGSVGIVRSYRTAQLAQRQSARVSVLAGFLILIVQLFLWWMLYKAPEWARGF